MIGFRERWTCKQMTRLQNFVKLSSNQGCCHKAGWSVDSNLLENMCDDLQCSDPYGTSIQEPLPRSSRHQVVTAIFWEHRCFARIQQHARGHAQGMRWPAVSKISALYVDILPAWLQIERVFHEEGHFADWVSTELSRTGYPEGMSKFGTWCWGAEQDGGLIDLILGCLFSVGGGSVLSSRLSRLLRLTGEDTVSCSLLCLPASDCVSKVEFLIFCLFAFGVGVRLSLASILTSFPVFPAVCDSKGDWSNFLFVVADPAPISFDFGRGPEIPAMSLLGSCISGLVALILCSHQWHCKMHCLWSCGCWWPLDHLSSHECPHVFLGLIYSCYHLLHLAIITGG